MVNGPQMNNMMYYFSLIQSLHPVVFVRNEVPAVRVPLSTRSFSRRPRAELSLGLVLTPLSRVLPSFLFRGLMLTSPFYRRTICHRHLRSLTNF